MSTDLGLEATRAVRERISHEHGNDPRRLVEHYLRFQARFADRLRRAPGSDERSGEAADLSGPDAALIGQVAEIARSRSAT